MEGKGSQRASGFDDVGVDELASRMSQRVFEQDANGEWQLVEIGQPLLDQSLEAVIRHRLAKRRRQARPRPEWIGRDRKRCGVHRMSVLFLLIGRCSARIRSTDVALVAPARGPLPVTRTMVKFRRRRVRSIGLCENSAGGDWSGMSDQAITFDFHNTLAMCPEWFELEVRRLPSTFLKIWSEHNGRAITPEQLSAADQSYRQLRAEIIDHGNELTAADCLEKVLSAVELSVPKSEIEVGIESIMLRGSGRSCPHRRLGADRTCHP